MVSQPPRRLIKFVNKNNSQIDRLWAFWQAFNPDAWFPKPKAGQLAENKKDLLPFYKTRAGPGNGTFFDSDDTKTTQLFGYIYDDFVGIKEGDRQALRKNIDEKYVWASRTPAHPNITDPPLNMRPLNVRSAYFFSKAPNASTRLFSKASGPTVSSTNGSTEAGQTDFASVANAVTPSVHSAVESVPAHVPNVTSGSQDIVATSLAPTKINSGFDREWYVDSVVNR